VSVEIRELSPALWPELERQLSQPLEARGSSAGRHSGIKNQRGGLEAAPRDSDRRRGSAQRSQLDRTFM
jgi:hypothetical protein